MAGRTITIRYTGFRECPNCGGRGDDGAAWRPFPCKRCEGRGRLVTAGGGGEAGRGEVAPSAHHFNAEGGGFFLDFGEE